MRKPLRYTALCLCTFLVLALAAPAMAQNFSGAIFTTTNDGTRVDQNVYSSKEAVYLNGGPQTEHSHGLPDGTYYFQVTDPNGTTLLSTDDVSCRQVQVTNEIFAGATGPCPHANGTPNSANGGSIPVQLIPFNDTPNSGGEYKVWLTPIAKLDPVNCAANHGFCDRDSKTDNFKVKASIGYITVCKFNDQNNNAVQDPGEPLLAHWPISPSVNGVMRATVQTQDNGCIRLAFPDLPADGALVTLQEGTFGPDWTPTAPADGAYDRFTVAGGSISVTLKPNDDLTAPNFGNYNPFCTVGCTAEGLVVTKDANPSFNRTFKWDISKSVDKTEIYTSGGATFNYTVTVTHDNGTDSAWQVTGAIKVSNPTGADITGVNVTDVVSNGGSCIIDSSNFDGTILAGNHVTLPYACTYSDAPSPAAGTNTATAVTDSAAVSGTANFDFSAASFNPVDGSVNVTDSLGGSLGTVSYTDPSPKTFTYSQTFTDPAGTCTSHNNTATFTSNTTGTTGSASQPVKVCVGADLALTKTAIATLNSNLTKNVDRTKVEQAGGSVTFNYTVTVTESGWAVSGNISVANPNDWEPITANLNDALNLSGASCNISGGAVQTIPPSSSISPAYSCVFSSAPPAASGSNTATAVWDPAASFTPNGSASASAGFAFGTLTVTDAFNGGTATTLGTITAPAATTSFTEARIVPNAIGGQCKSYTNTATIVETGANSSQTVTVCNTKTAALTIGFWQNKNGQGIITGGASTAGVCNSGTFLRGFAPFQDLSATASCNQVGSYVTSIIKAANASGASMNAMLKAQMLSTALDVFFSIQIGAPTPLGTVNIDLTHVCKMIDSGSIGTCSGTLENVSSAFGGATSLTVADMLTYAASQSNAGGITWYGQLKAVQQLAKDAFDAINNQAAYIAP